MENKQLIAELNKILFLEHAHLGLYKSQLHLVRKRDIKRAFVRFMEMEAEHIENRISKKYKRTPFIHLRLENSVLIKI